MNYRIYLHFKAQTKWLGLSRSERRKIFQDDVKNLIEKYTSLSFCWVDLEGFSADVTDIAELSTQDLKNYYFFIEELKDSRIFTQAYFDLVKIQIGIVEGFINYEKQKETQ